MATRVEIMNLGLRGLGALSIASPTEDSENARRMSAIYDMELKAMLRLHPWSFAKKESALAQLVETPTLTEYTYVYQLPADFVKLLQTDVEDNGYSHKIKGRKLYSNATAVNIGYIYFIEDTATFDDSFADAFAARLAAHLAYAITGDKDVAKIAIALATQKLNEAKNLNAQEITPDQPTNDTWINSRL